MKNRKEKRVCKNKMYLDIQQDQFMLLSVGRGLRWVVDIYRDIINMIWKYQFNVVCVDIQINYTGVGRVIG